MAGGNDELWPPGSGDEFRTEIRELMEMGMPNLDSARPTFHFDPHRVFDEAGLDGQPFDWRSDPASSNPKDDVQVLCGVEAISGLGAGVSVDEHPTGSFAGERLKLTFFEDEWAEVFDFTAVTFGEGTEAGPVTYERIRKFKDDALFDVDVHTVEVKAPDA